jgi:hypothetical protein
LSAVIEPGGWSNEAFTGGPELAKRFPASLLSVHGTCPAA